MRSPLDFFQIIRMKPRLGVFTLPLFKANAEKIQQGSIGKNGFFPGPYDGDVLGREVQNLPELDFTSAAFLLCPFTLSDVDHSAHKLKEIAGRAQNRMSNDVNVPDGAIRMHDAVVRLPLRLLADRGLS